MAQESPSKIKVNEVQQVCLVVKDLQKTIEAYWNILGIGPWALFDFGSERVPNFQYYGKPAYARYRGAIAQCGPIELELFETIEGPSVYQDWIDKHGESLHHLKFVPEDVAKTEKILNDMGFPTVVSGGSGNYRFAYFDIKPLRCFWEISSRSRHDGPPAGATFYPEDPKAKSPAKVKISGIKQVGIVVKDAVRTAENYWQILGIGPWEIRPWGNHVLWDRTYMGRPGWGRERLGHAYLGDLELELVQPVEGESVYQDWIDEHGEGIHHLKFLCDDIDEVTRLLGEQGFPSIQSGHFGDPKEKAGGFNYIDIPPLHCIFEPVHKPKSLPIDPVARVPEK
ncbi:MAG: VOC family protein [Dehalococcoidales bacterium]|nr:VOC family protein [Dehalococcoidales bacterium]